MELERPQLYYFLLPFTAISLFLYVQILIEIFRKRKLLVYDSFFYRMICSQSIYDISYVVMYFVTEIPQDWPSMYDFLTGMNGTILPQLDYAHSYACGFAQTLGVTAMSISRLLLVCYPSNKITKILKNLRVQEVVIAHFILPAIYAGYIIAGQDWRWYGFEKNADRVTRLGSKESIAINSYILCASSFSGAVASAFCYIRVFLALRKRPLRSYRSELSILATSFALFCALCATAGYFVCNMLFVGANWTAFYTFRKHFYAFSFFLSLANPWCLMFTSESMRSSVICHCLPSCLTRLPLCARCFPHSTPHGTGEASTPAANKIAPEPKSIFIPSI